MNKLFLLILTLSVGYIGFRMGEKTVKEEEFQAEVEEALFSEKNPRSFVFIVYASNHAAWCERSLGSIFSQDYGSYRVIFVDDASRDHTYEKAKNFVVKSAQDERVILIRNETKQGFLSSLEKSLEHCLEDEMIIPMQAKDWLAQENILLRLNKAFQNLDTWVVRSYALSYPKFCIEDAKGLIAFRGALLKTLSLNNLEEKEILDPQEACEQAIVELSKDRVKTLKSAYLFANQADGTLRKQDGHAGF